MLACTSVQTLRAPTECGAAPGPPQAFVLFRAPHQRLRVFAFFPPIRPDGFVVLISRRGQRAEGPAWRVPNRRLLRATRHRSDTNAHNPGGADLCTRKGAVLSSIARSTTTSAQSTLGLDVTPVVPQTVDKRVSLTCMQQRPDDLYAAHAV